MILLVLGIFTLLFLIAIITFLINKNLRAKFEKILLFSGAVVASTAIITSSFTGFISGSSPWNGTGVQVFYDDADAGTPGAKNWTASITYDSGTFVSSPNSILAPSGANLQYTQENITNLSLNQYPLSLTGSFYDDGTTSANAKWIGFSNTSTGCFFDLQLGNSTGYYVVRDQNNCGTTQGDKDGDVARSTAWHTFNMTWYNSTNMSVRVDGTLIYNRLSPVPVNVTALTTYTQVGVTIRLDNIRISHNGAFVPESAGIIWSENYNNISKNIGDPWYFDANATNQTVRKIVQNYTINDTLIPMDNETGIINITLNSSFNGIRHLSIRAYDNQTTPEYIEQNITLNVTHITTPQLCDSILDIVLNANVTRGDYNWSTNTYTEWNITPINHSECRFDYILNNSINVVNITYNLTSNITEPTITLMVNSQEINATINYSITVENGTHQEINITLSFNETPLEKADVPITLNWTYT